MRIFNVLCLFFLQGFFANSVKSESFRPGDILLAPMNCYLCKLIEGETNSDYSHLFVYIGEGRFAHALSKVEYVYLSTIKKIVDNTRPMALVRHTSSAGFDPNILRSTFETKFNNLPYDKDFLWFNKDRFGRSKLYCSEFVLKLLNESFHLNLSPIPMTYDYQPEQWDSYFQSEAPRGLPGVSPSFFETHNEFVKIKYIYPGN